MADIEKVAGSSQYVTLHTKTSGSGSQEKNLQFLSDTESGNVLLGANTEVKRELKSRHIAMIALGGTIGTGLFIGMGTTLRNAGPVPALISYIFMTTLAFTITQSLGEMATYMPITGSFNQYIGRWCSPALGAANGFSYWFSWSVTFALELSVVGQIIQYWTDAVPLAAWISIFLVVLTCSNLVPVKFYGEIEFWVASIKIIAIVGWLIYALCMVCGAGKTGPIGFRYWRNPGPWGPGILVKDINTARFLGWLNSLVSAAFTFQGCELVALTAGEVNSRTAIPRAIKKVFYRIILFFILSLFFIGLLIPYDNEDLDGDQTANSPFIIAIKLSGTPILPDIFNAVILMTIISAGNSNVYSGSRVLYALAESKLAPKIFLRTNKYGVPWVSVLATAVMGCLGYMATSESGAEVFNWLVNITAVAGLITWGWIAAAHIRFMHALKYRGISRDELPFKAKFMPWSAHYAAWAVFILIFVQGYAAFFNFTAGKFFTKYISVIFFVVIYIGFHFHFNGFGKQAFTKRAFWIPLEECDIETGAMNPDDAQWAPEVEPSNLWEKFWAVLS